MFNTIAMWSGVAGIFASIFAVVVIYLTRKNILDILDKDVILFDKNFEIKKQAIEKSFKLLDDLNENSRIATNPEYIRRAKECYNEMICVMTDLKLADLFNTIALKGGEINSSILAQYKVSCREDLGLKSKHKNHIKKSAKTETENPSKPEKPTKQENQVEPSKSTPKEEPKTASQQNTQTQANKSE